MSASHPLDFILQAVWTGCGIPGWLIFFQITKPAPPPPSSRCFQPFGWASHLSTHGVSSSGSFKIFYFSVLWSTLLMMCVDFVC